MTELEYTGTTETTLLVTVFDDKFSACPPYGVCIGFADGLVYETVIKSPATAADERVNLILEPDIAIALILLGTEFTRTVNAEVAGIMLARLLLNVMSKTEGAVFSITEL